MATSANKNFQGGGGSPGSAGDNSTRVDRPNEGLPGVATTDGTTTFGDPTTPTRGNFDTYKATSMRGVRPKAYIDTTETSGQDRSIDVKRMDSAQW